jgi:hypothetical protein
MDQIKSGEIKEVRFFDLFTDFLLSAAQLELVILVPLAQSILVP